MEELLSNPAVQAGVAPFVVALIVAAVTRNSRWLGLAVPVALATVVGLAVGFAFDPLTAARKLVLCGLAAGALALVLDLAGVQRSKAADFTLTALAGAAALWVTWRVLMQQEGTQVWIWGAGCVALAAGMTASMLRASTSAVGAVATGLGVGLGGGLLALLGASAFLAQVGIALGAGSGAVLLVMMLGGKRMSSCSRLGLPVAVAGSLLVLLSVLTGSLPWFAAAPMLLAPWAARLVPQERFPVWITAVLVTVAVIIPMLVAAGLARFAAPAVS